MSSKQYIENGRIKENIRAENVRTNEDVILISNLDGWCMRFGSFWVDS